METTLELDIEGLSHDGRGIAARRQGELVTFVAGALPGEHVRATLTAEKKGFREALCTAVLTPSPDAVVPSCPHADECGGCPLMRMPYDAQLFWKKQIEENALRRIGHLDEVPVDPVRPSPLTDGFRNKVEFAFCRDADGAVRLGMRRRNSHETVPTPHCRLLPEQAAALIPAIEAACTRLHLSVYEGADEAGEETENKRQRRNPRRRRADDAPAGLLRFCQIRTGTIPDMAHIRAGAAGTAAVWLVLVTSRASQQERDAMRRLAAAILEACPTVESIIHEERRGTDFQHQGLSRTFVLGRQGDVAEGALMSLSLLDREYLCDAGDFFQVNPQGAAILARCAADGFREGDLLDLYCGVGAPGLSCLRQGQLQGIEYAERSVENARLNARRFGIRARYQAGDAARLLSRALKDRSWPQILCDPPRAGLAKEVVQGMLADEPERIVYISCNPATLARDLALLAGTYAIQRVTPVDLFPHTPHVETCVLLKKRPR